MQIISSNGLLHYLGNLGSAILGKSGRFNFYNSFTKIDEKTILEDCSYNNLIMVAQNVPHLNVVISRGAEMFSEMDIKHLDKKGKEVENSEVLKLLNKPNPLQSLEGFLYDYYIQNAVYSSAYGYKNKPGQSSKLPKVLWWLPSGLMTINATGKIYRQYDISGIIKNYEMEGDPQPFSPEEIIHIVEGVGQNPLKRTSRIHALQIPLSNIMAALKSNNVILSERGMIGFISREGADVNSGMPVNKEEKDKFQKQYRNDYSLDSTSGHVGIFSSALKWVPMTFDVGQLKLYEGLEDSFGQICGAYGIDRDIFPSIKGATNENKEMGLKATIQNTMQPLGTKLCNVLADHLGVTEKGETLECCFDHMPIMKEDELKEYQAKKAQAEYLSTLLKDGVINHETYATLAGVELTGDKTIKYNERANQQGGAAQS